MSFACHWTPTYLMFRTTEISSKPLLLALLRLPLSLFLAPCSLQVVHLVGPSGLAWVSLISAWPEEPTYGLWKEQRQQEVVVAGQHQELRAADFQPPEKGSAILWATAVPRSWLSRAFSWSLRLTGCLQLHKWG